MAGQIGWNGQCQFESHDYIGQVRQTLINIKGVLAEAEAKHGLVHRLYSFLRRATADRLHSGRSGRPPTVGFGPAI